jgi:uncharacterized repeat protein (TIGR01451 family)
MKRLYILGLSFATLAASVAIASGMPLLKDASNAWAKEPIAQQPQRQVQVELELAAQKQVVTRDAQGKKKTSWQPLTKNNTVVQPGDTLRYMVNSKNISERAIDNLAITQPIPQGTMYVLNSAKMGLGSDVAVTYSIDGGKTFTANPTIKIELADGKVETSPAPAEAYTHVRWQFSEVLKPSVAFKSSYQVSVR